MKKLLKRAVIGISVLLILVVALAMVAGRDQWDGRVIPSDEEGSAPTPSYVVATPRPKPTKVVTDRFVRYAVAGTAKRVSITLSNATGGTEQYGDCPVPYDYQFRAEKGTFLYISAQNQGDSGTVITTIWVDGKRFKESKSSGAYVIASASGSVPR